LRHELVDDWSDVAATGGHRVPGSVCRETPIIEHNGSASRAMYR